jgi:hypothetical protein
VVCVTGSVSLSLMASTTVNMAEIRVCIDGKTRMRASKAQDTGVRRGEGRQRSRPLRTGNSPKVGRKVCKAQEGAQSPSDRLKKKIWTVGFYV